MDVEHNALGPERCRAVDPQSDAVAVRTHATGVFDGDIDSRERHHRCHLSHALARRRERFGGQSREIEDSEADAQVGIYEIMSHGGAPWK